MQLPLLPVINAMLPRPGGGNVHGVVLDSYSIAVFTHNGGGKYLLLCPWNEAAGQPFHVGVIAVCREVELKLCIESKTGTPHIEGILRGTRAGKDEFVYQQAGNKYSTGFQSALGYKVFLAVSGTFQKRFFLVICMYTPLCTYNRTGVGVMLARIGDKMINKQKILDAIDVMISLRQQGMSQQEVANRLGVDRTVISRLETLGEIRKGGQIALVGFPICNGAELTVVAEEEGIDFVLLLTEKERWSFVEHKSGAELFNEIMLIVAKLRTYDTLIFIGSNMRIKLVEALLDKEVIGIQIGESPIAEDKHFDPQELRTVICHLKSREA